MWKINKISKPSWDSSCLVESLVQAHHSQTQMLTQEAQGNHVQVTLLTVHSQDHLMTSIAFTDLAEELIELYRRINVE